LVQPENISMLQSFKRGTTDPAADLLSYPSLAANALAAKSKIPVLLEEFWRAEPGSIEEEYQARLAAIGYLVLTGEQLQTTEPRWQHQVSDRFTEASIEIYGEPDANKAANLAARKLKQYRGYVGNPDVDQDRLQRVVSFYEDQLGSAEIETTEEMDPLLRV